MKRIATVCAAFLLTFAVATTAAAQSFSYGITAGLNLTKLKFTNSSIGDNLSSDNRAGWFVGPKVEFNTVIGLGFDAAAEYSQRKLNVTSSDYTSETKTYRTLEIPVNVRYNIGLGRLASVYVATGPQFGFAFSNMKWKYIDSGDNFKRSNLNTTWNIGAGVRLLKHLEAGVGYNFAIGKVGKAILPSSMTGTSTDTEINYKSNTFQVQVAYLF